MILKQLALRDFRNYQSASFELQAPGNLIIAPNGRGKTNLLEAIAYCGLGRSVRFHQDCDLPRETTPGFQLRGDFGEDGGGELSIQISWQEGKKLLKINGLPERQLSRIYECVKVIYLAPEDVHLVGGNTKARRRQYFDLAIAQLYPRYIGLLREYLHVVQQRNILLKQSWLPAEKRGWDKRFAELMLEVLSYRSRYLELLNQTFGGQYPQISEQVRDIRIEYVCQVPGAYPADADGILRLLAEWSDREKRYQRSLLGPHLDDYCFRMAGHELRTFGSQGQKRITVVILKLIQAALIEQLTKIKPVLLFDDVLAELDALHTGRVREYVDQRYQIFIASPRESVASAWPGLTRLGLGEAGA